LPTFATCCWIARLIQLGEAAVEAADETVEAALEGAAAMDEDALEAADGADEACDGALGGVTFETVVGGFLATALGCLLGAGEEGFAGAFIGALLVGGLAPGALAGAFTGGALVWVFDMAYPIDDDLFYWYIRA